MRESLKGATHRSDKFEAEKEALVGTKNEQSVNGAAAAKEVTSSS